MTFVQRLFRIELSAHVALVSCAVATALLFPVLSLLLERTPSPLRYDDLSGLLGVALFAYLCGILPVVLYGAPAYTYLEAKGRVTWRAVLLIGALPGAALLPISALPSMRNSDISPAMAAIVLLSGIFVAAATHIMRAQKGSIVGAA